MKKLKKSGMMSTKELLNKLFSENEEVEVSIGNVMFGGNTPFEINVEKGGRFKLDADRSGNFKIFTKEEKVSEHRNLIFRYIKRHNKIVGLLVGYSFEDGKFSTGWSLCNDKDEFDMQKALSICFYRLTVGNERPPHSVEKEFMRFFTNCCKYFVGHNYVLKNEVQSVNRAFFCFVVCFPVEFRKKWGIGRFTNYLPIMEEAEKERKEREKVRVFYAAGISQTPSFLLVEHNYFQTPIFTSTDTTFNKCTKEKPSGPHIKVTWELVD